MSIIKHKIKCIDSLDQGWHVNTYRAAEYGELRIKDGTIDVLVGAVFVEMDKILSVQKVHSSTGIEIWLEIFFLRKNKKRRLYVCSKKHFGFANYSGDTLQRIQADIQSCIMQMSKKTIS